MKKSFFLVLTFIFSWVNSQITASDIKFFVGTGSQTAYFVADFKDGTDDHSYVWGVKFNPGENMNGAQMLQKIAAEEPKFSYIVTNGFLDKIQFNTHSEESGNDWWSLWASDNGSIWNMAGWMNSGVITNGEWYGATYGWNPGPEEPTTPIPAYSSQWFPVSTSITNWIGTGSNQGVVVVDFGTDNNGTPNSFAFGIKYNGNITADQALQLIANQNSNFIYSINNNNVESLSLNSLNANNSGNNSWKTFKGTNLSDWTTQGNFSQTTLSNNSWLGLSFGSRRPFIPQEASYLSVSNPKNNKQNGITIAPNPTTDYIVINSVENILKTSIYTMNGQKIFEGNTSKINVANYTSGTYILEIVTSKGTQSSKFIKK